MQPDWIKPETDIQKLTTEINKFIRNHQKLKDSICKSDSEWDKLYMNLDLIHHGDDALDYFIKLDDRTFKEHSTMYIFGTLQSIFTIQDAIKELHNLIIKQDLKQTSSLEQIIKLYDCADQSEIHPLCKLRWHRNNLIGHPTTRDTKKASAFEKNLNNQHFSNHTNEDCLTFFLSYESSKTKKNIEYATYAPEFISINLDLIEGVYQQRSFTKKFLEQIEQQLHTRQ